MGDASLTPILYRGGERWLKVIFQLTVMPGAAPSAHENPPPPPFFKGGDQFQSYFNPPPFVKGGLGGFKGIF